MIVLLHLASFSGVFEFFRNSHCVELCYSFISVRAFFPLFKSPGVASFSFLSFCFTISLFFSNASWENNCDDSRLWKAEIFFFRSTCWSVFWRVLFSQTRDCKTWNLSFHIKSCVKTRRYSIIILSIIWLIKILSLMNHSFKVNGQKYTGQLETWRRF